MNQSKQKIIEGELAALMKKYCIARNRFADEKNEPEIQFHKWAMESSEEKIKNILFDLWQNGQITISFN